MSNGLSFPGGFWLVLERFSEGGGEREGVKGQVGGVQEEEEEGKGGVQGSSGCFFFFKDRRRCRCEGGVQGCSWGGSEE